MCPHCHDTYWKPVTVDGIERVVRCDCWRSDVVATLLREAHIPPRFARATLDNFERWHQRSADRVAEGDGVRRSVPRRRQGAAPLRTEWRWQDASGDRHPRACITEKGARAYFFETRELLRQIRDTYNRSVEETEMEVLNPALTPTC